MKGTPSISEDFIEWKLVCSSRHVGWKLQGVITQNIPKVVKCNLKVTAKTTLERNWLFFPERDLSDINLTRPDIGINTLNYADG